MKTLEELGAHTEILLRNSAELLLRCGCVLSEARKLIGDDNEFRKWIEKKYGGRFVQMTLRLIRVGFKSDTYKSNVRLASLNAIADLDAERIDNENALIGEDDRDKLKQLEKLEKALKENEALKDLLDEKDKELLRLRKAQGAAVKDLGKAVGARQQAEVVRLREQIAEREAEMQRIKRIAAAADEEKVKRLALSDFASAAQLLFVSPAAVTLLTVCLNDDDRARLGEIVRDLSEQSQRFGKRTGASSE